MFKKRYFDITALDAIAKTIGKEQNLSGQDYAALRSLHCMDWIDMGPELAGQVKKKVTDFLCLTVFPEEVQATKSQVEVLPTKSQVEVEKKHLKLAFWRSV